MMMRVFPLVAITVLCTGIVEALSLSMLSEQRSMAQSRRAFVVTSVGPAISIATSLQPTGRAEAAAPTVYKLDNGIKYAITKDVSNGSVPREGDIVAIEYTGYLATGAIFDATHSEGKKNALLFKLGSTAVNVGINSMVGEMKVGQKVQAIIPPELAFGEKGICLEDGECLVKPGSTLVYDILLKKASIPPP